MLQYSALDIPTLGMLKKLMNEDFLSSTRLVGGTALALQYGHRKSIDLDFFGNIDDDAERLKDILRALGNIRIIKESANIKQYLANGVKMDFINYRYPWIDNIVEEDGIRFASDKDIAAMKVNAIQGRGTKKDFIDMFFILKQYSLNEILSFYKAKYPEFSIFRAIMSLTYFADADEEEMPQMLTDVSWEDIKQSIFDNVQSYKFMGQSQKSVDRA